MSRGIYNFFSKDKLHILKRSNLEIAEHWSFFKYWTKIF